jgi:D-isomer specific 2-hydroxyacid dehydrogenase, catalytic domain
MFPEPGPSRVLRLDTKALHAALDAERKTRGLTWEEVATELPGLTVSMLRNLSTGPLIGFPRVMMLTQWLRLEVLDWLGVGLDNIDVGACARRGVAARAAIGTNHISVAEYALGATLFLSRPLCFATAAVAEGKWPRTSVAPGRELAGRALGPRPRSHKPQSASRGVLPWTKEPRRSRAPTYWSSPECRSERTQ